jgi:DNA-binding MarR family transcriptional regulator
MTVTNGSATDAVIREINQACMLMRTRLISRVMTGIYDAGLRPFGIGAPQLALLVVIGSLEPATRADIGRYLHQDRSTLTRNLKLILSEGWAKEIRAAAGGRARPIALTRAGRDLLRKAVPAWRVAQSRAKALLTQDGMIAVMTVADRIVRSPLEA